MSYIISIISILVSFQINVPITESTIPRDFTLEELPEYVVISCEATKAQLNRTLIVNINRKRSKYEKPLAALENYLTSKQKLAIASQTDLLNAMSELGFDYVNAYNIGTANEYINAVFRKKEEFRG